MKSVSKVVVFFLVVLLPLHFVFAYDWLLFNTYTDSGERKAAQKVIDQYIEDYTSSYNDVVVIRVSPNGQRKVVKGVDGPKTKHRVIYVDHSIDSNTFLGYLDGSQLNANRRDNDRKIAATNFLGHFSPKGAESFSQEQNSQAHGKVEPWQKNITRWEKDLRAQGISTEELFTPSSTTMLGGCYGAQSTTPGASMAQYMANIQPETSRVLASDDLTYLKPKAGDVSWPFYVGQRKDIYPEPGSGSMDSFHKGDRTNEEMNLQTELSFFKEEVAKFKEELNTLPFANQDAKDEYIKSKVQVFEDWAARHFEQNEAIKDLKKLTGDLRYGDVSFTPDVFDQLNDVAQSAYNNLRNPRHEELDRQQSQEPSSQDILQDKETPASQDVPQDQQIPSPQDNSQPQETPQSPEPPETSQSQETTQSQQSTSAGKTVPPEPVSIEVEPTPEVNVTEQTSNPEVTSRRRPRTPRNNNVNTGEVLPGEGSQQEEGEEQGGEQETPPETGVEQDLNGLTQTLLDWNVSMAGKLSAVNDFYQNYCGGHLFEFPSGVVPTEDGGAAEVEVPSYEEVRQQEINQQAAQQAAMQILGAAISAGVSSMKSKQSHGDSCGRH